MGRRSGPEPDGGAGPAHPARGTGVSHDDQADGLHPRNGPMWIHLVHEIVARHPAVGFVTNPDDLGIRRGNAQQLTLWRRPPAALSEKGRARLAPSEGYRVVAREISPMLVEPAADLTEADLTPWLTERLHDFVNARMNHPESAEIFVHSSPGGPVPACSTPHSLTRAMSTSSGTAAQWRTHGCRRDWRRGHPGTLRLAFRAPAHRPGSGRGGRGTEPAHRGPRVAPAHRHP